MNEICYGGLHAIDIGDVGRREVIHLVVENNPSIGKHLGTKPCVDSPERNHNQHVTEVTHATFSTGTFAHEVTATAWPSCERTERWEVPESGGV